MFFIFLFLHLASLFYRSSVKTLFRNRERKKIAYVKHLHYLRHLCRPSFKKTRTDICSLTCSGYVIFKGGLTSR